MLNKTDLKREFKGQISQSGLTTMFAQNNLLYKSQSVKFGNRFGKSVRLYLVKHISEAIEESKRLQLRNCDKDKDKDKCGELLIDDENVLKIIKSLKSFRTDISKEKGIPPYCVLSNATITLIAQSGATNLNELLMVKGIGKQKLADYGQSILDLMSGQF